MVRSVMHSVGGRLLGWLVLTGLLTVGSAITPVPLVGGLDEAGQFGAGKVHAQGEMDIGIVSPSFSGLPASVEPGQQFALTASTAPGARCAGQIVFRNHPPIALEAQPAPAGTCSWPVDVPPTVRPSTATIAIDLSRSGQHWALYGIVYVRAPGEPR